MRLQTVSKVAAVVAICLAMGATASAQYGGGGGMGGGGMGGGGGTGGGTGGTGTGTSNHSYSSGSGAAAVGIAVGAAGAVGIALLVRHHHKAKSPEALLIGCTQSQPNGISLKSEGTGETYTLVSSGKHVEPGKRVELKGVVKNDRSGGYTFHVRDVVTDFGACSQSQVASTQSLNGKELISRAEY